MRPIHIPSDREEIFASKLVVLVLASVVPGLGYFLLVGMGLLFGFTAPARFLLKDLLAQSWSAPVLWMIVVGGPVLSVVGSLSAQTVRQNSSRFLAALGWVGLSLVMFNALILLFYMDQLVVFPP